MDLNEEVEIRDDLLQYQIPAGIKIKIDYPNPSNWVEIRLIVKVGSLMEEDHQQGYAHFIEHLGFKGTKLYPNYNMVRQLQSLGITYGPDLNASTHFQETIFRISLSYEINTYAERLKTAVNIIIQWATSMEISHSDVEEEKSVILAEYRNKQGVNQRVLQQYWNEIFGENTLLSNRFPIGKPETIIAANNEDLKLFYSQWYRPELMTMLIVGDLSNKKMEILKEIISQQDIKFSNIDNKTLGDDNSDSNYFYEKYMNNNCGKDRIISICDAELNKISLSIEFYRPFECSKTVKFIYNDVLIRLMSTIIDKRFSFISKGYYKHILSPEEAPFQTAGVSIHQAIRGLQCVTVTVTLSNNVDSSSSSHDNLKRMVERSVSVLLYEMWRFFEKGIQVEELDYAKERWRQVFTSNINGESKMESSSIMSELESYVLNDNNIVFSDKNKESEIALKCLDNITLDEINKFFLQLDMHLDEKSSVYYKTKCSFRAIALQYPSLFGKNGENKKAIDPFKKDDLIQILSDCRQILNNLEKPSEFPSHSKISPEDIINASKIALDNVSCLKKNGVQSGNHKCRCCDPINFLPAYLLTDKSLRNKNVIDELLTYKVKEAPSVGMKEIILSNGITVSCKWMPEESINKISFQAFSIGGSSELSELEEAAFFIIDSVASASGFEVRNESSSEDIGEIIKFSGSNIHDIQSRHQTRVSTQRHHFHRGIGGSSPNDKIELLLAFIVLKLTSQNFNETEVEKEIKSQIDKLNYSTNSPESSFMNEVSKICFGDIPIFRPFTSELLSQIDVKLVRDLYNKAFMNDPTKFNYVFIGDLPQEEILFPLLESFLGSLKVVQKNFCQWVTEESYSKKLLFTPLNNNFPKEHVSKSIKLRISNKSSILYVFQYKMPSDAKLDLLMSILIDASCRVLQNYLLEILRITLGKIYSLMIESSRSSLSSFCIINIVMDCDPVDVDTVKEVLNSEIANLKMMNISSSYLAGIRESLLQQHLKSLKNPSYWLFWILDSYKSLKVENNENNKIDWIESLIMMKSLKREELLNQAVNETNIMNTLVEILNMDSSVFVCLEPLIEENS